MRDYIQVRIDRNELLEMLIDRLETMWTNDDDAIELYSDMYERYIDDGVFDNIKFSVSEIVDNDWVNYCDIVRKGDDYYEECVEALDKPGVELDGDKTLEGYKELGDGEYIFLIRQ